MGVVRWFLALALALVAIAPAGAAAAAMTAGAPTLLTVHRVDIGGSRRLNLVCIGKGSPTVVFDQGWGETILDWATVQAPVSAITRACFYDRAGHGYSDPAVRSPTPMNITSDLLALIDHAGIRGSVVLVGHSLGGLNATLFADRFPDRVAGLVLVDPSFAGQDDPPQSDAEKRARTAGAKAMLDELSRCANLARRRQLSLADPRGCFSSKPPFTKAEIDYLAPAFIRPFRWEAMAAELGHTGDEQAFARPWGDRPVIVLTHGLAPLAPNESQAAHEAAQSNLKLAHDRLAARSSRGRSIVVAGAGHDIQRDQPQAVVDAIGEVVSAVRQGSAAAHAPTTGYCDSR